MICSALTIATALGGRPSGSGWHRARCPVHNGERDSLALKAGHNGLVLKCHAGCRRDDVVAALQRLGLMTGSGVGYAPFPTHNPEKDAAERKRRIGDALEIWRASVPAGDTIADVYLWSRLFDLFSPVPPSIRFHRSLYHSESGQRRPAMVALVKHVEHGIVGVHATYLTPDGSGKAALNPVRKCFGPISGGAVRLAPITGDTLIVGEGIENAASVMVATGLPGWSALSATNLPKLILPHEIRRVIIAADNDQNEVGQKAAIAAARLWRAMGRKVVIAWPPDPGDFNDILRAEGILGVEGARV